MAYKIKTELEAGEIAWQLGYNKSASFVMGIENEINDLSWTQKVIKKMCVSMIDNIGKEGVAELLEKLRKDLKLKRSN